MKVKLDQNLSQYLRDESTPFKHDIDTVFHEGLSGAPDPQVLKAATAQDRILFTLDQGFLDLNAYPPSSQRSVGS